MTKILTKLSLAAMLSLGSCVGVNAPVRPFHVENNETFAVRNVQKQNTDYVPVYTNLHSTVIPNNAHIRDSIASDVNGLDQNQPKDNLINYSLKLPQEFAHEDTFIDAGLVQIAVRDENLTLRPVYSPAYNVSLKDNLRIHTARDYEVRDYSDFHFRNDILSELPDDDPERAKHDESLIIASLGRWLWDQDALKPIRIVADDVKHYSNSAVRSVFGAHSELDYNNGRIVLGFTGLRTEYFDIGFSAWAGVDDFDKKGLIFEMSFHGRRN